VTALDHFQSLQTPGGYYTAADLAAGRRTDFEINSDEHLRLFLAGYPGAERCTGDDARCQCAWHRRQPKIDLASVGAILDAEHADETTKGRAAWLADLHAETPRVAALTPDMLPAWLEFIAEETRA